MKSVIKVIVGVIIITIGRAISLTFFCGVITGILVMGANALIDAIMEGK